MPFAFDADAAETAFGGGRIEQGGIAASFRTEPAGPLVVTSGALVAADPLVMPETAPFSRPVPTGTFPVELAIAVMGDDERVAYARIRFAGDRSPVSWRLATSAGQDPSLLGPGEFYGYGVDAGTGCFMDVVAARLLIARMEADDDYGMQLADDLQDDYRPTWCRLDTRPDPTAPENVVCFSSGWGDGSYPTFFGLDADGAVLAVVTDFLLLAEDDAEDEAPPASDGARRRFRFPWRH